MSEMLQMNMKRVVAATALVLGGGALAGCGGESEQPDQHIVSVQGPCDGLENVVGKGTNQEICYPKKNLRIVRIANSNGRDLTLHEFCDETTLIIKQENPDGGKRVHVPHAQENMPACDDSTLSRDDYHGPKKFALY